MKPCRWMGSAANAARRLVSALPALLAGLALLAAAPARAVTTLEISPRGLLPDARSVSVVLTARFTPGASVKEFSIRYNGRDVTADFVRYASLARPDTGSIVATIDVLFPAGRHDVSASLLMSGDTRVDASTSFQVPDTNQERLRASVLARLNEFARQYDGLQFGRVISLGDMARFGTRLADPSFQVYVDPATLDKMKLAPRAAYLELWNFGLSYYRDLVLRHDPDLFGLGRTPDTDFHPFLLWEEVVHALSHTATTDALPDPGGSADAQAVDHFYLDWVEPCVRAGLPALKDFEDVVVRQGAAPPSDATLRLGRGKWRIFVNYCNTTLGDRGVPTAAQREAFRRLVGFDVDAAKIRAAYLSAGVDKTWFEAATVQLVSPTGGSVSASQIDARATVVLSEGARVDRVGFLINGTVVYATLQSNAFSATLPLDPGRNTIQAGLITRPAPGTEVEVVMSPPVTVTRQATTPVCPLITTWTNADQTLFTPLRVTRVEHSNSPTAAYFYGLANPNDRQERTIKPTFFLLSGAPSLTRDLSFSNNLGLGLYSFSSGADARTVWDRELAAWDAMKPADRPELLLRDDTTLVWAWTAWLDGQRNLMALSLLDGSVIAAYSLRSNATGETSANQGMAGLIRHVTTVRGLVDQKCGGR